MSTKKSIVIRALLLTPIVSSLLVLTAAQAQTPIRISVQPANYSALPFHVATTNNFWASAGLSPSFVRYAAGVPQIKAHADWDFGVAGTVPALIGARDFNLVTIAISNDESRTNLIVAKKELVEKVKRERTIPKGTKFAVSLNSTADYAAQVCLALWGGNTKTDMDYKGGSQADIVKAGADGTADVLAVWSPYQYVLREKHGYEELCSAKDFGRGVLGAVFTDRAYAEKNPELVAKFLAVMMRSVNWIKANPQLAQEIFIKTSDSEGVKVLPTDAKSEYELRPLFGLDEQLNMMGASKEKINDSQAGRSFFTINIFLNEGKPGAKSMKPAAFMDAQYFQMVKQDPALLKLATMNN